MTADLTRVVREQTLAAAQHCALALAELGDKQFIPDYSQRLLKEQIPPADCISMMLPLTRAQSEEASEICREALRMVEKHGRTEKNRVNLRSALSEAATVLLQTRRSADVRFILRLFLGSPWARGMRYSLLGPLVEPAAVPYSMEDLEEDDEEYSASDTPDHPPPDLVILNDVLEHLGKTNRSALADELRHAIQSKRYADAILRVVTDAENIYRKALKQAGKASMRARAGRGVAPWWNLAVLRAVGAEWQQIADAPRPVQRRLAVTATLVYAGLVDQEPFLALDPERMSPDRRLAVFLQDRNDTAYDNELIELLAGAPPQNIAALCRAFVASHPDWIAAGRVIRLLSRMRDAESIPLLISAGSRESSDPFALSAAFQQFGDEALPYLEPTLNSAKDTEIDTATGALGDIWTRGAHDLFLSRFERLYFTHREEALRTASVLGAAELAPLLKARLKADEPEEFLFRFLCRLNGIEDPLLAGIEQKMGDRLAEEETALSRLDNDDPRGLDLRLRLKLYCSSCAKSFVVAVEEVTIGLRLDGVSSDTRIEHSIRCKWCGTVDRYEITDEAHDEILERLETMLAFSDDHPESFNRGPVRVSVAEADEAAARLDRYRSPEDYSFESSESRVLQYRHPEPKVGRNDPCPCGSGKKYKKCCAAR
ncbi:MAG TPA: SEC-C metal-binding domain-containing protein [Acidobacteriota bacterium]|nr:SEC-C metal-binding domain-containing protein [Acidobacteriota bacterium]